MVKVFVILAGNTLNSHAEFLRDLVRSTKATLVDRSEDCDVTLTFCPIVSRVGTDIEAAIRQIPTTIPGVLVALHPTFNPEYIVPDINRYVLRSDLLTVSCLFHEGELLNSHCNDQALRQVAQYLLSFQREITPRPHRHDPHPHRRDPHPPSNQDSGCLHSILQQPRYVLVALIVIIIVFFFIALFLILSSTNSM